MGTKVYGVAAFEYAPVTTTGLLPSSGWKKVAPIADDAVTLDVPAVATNKIRAQDIPGVFAVLPGDTDPPTMKVTQLVVDGATAADLIGGTWDASTKTYNAPASQVIKQFAARITSQPFEGQQAIFFIPKGSILSAVSVSFVRNDLVKIGFTVEGVTPTDASGVAQSPWGFQIVDVVPAG